MSKLTTRHSFRLNDSNFNRLEGSETMANLIRYTINVFRITDANTETYVHYDSEMANKIKQWCTDNCTDLYYFEIDMGYKFVSVKFASNDDAIKFKLMME